MIDAKSEVIGFITGRLPKGEGKKRVKVIVTNIERLIRNGELASNISSGNSLIEPISVLFIGAVELKFVLEGVPWSVIYALLLSITGFL